MIDFFNKRLFLHPSRTGGTSIEVAIIRDCMETQDYEPYASIYGVWDKYATQHWPYKKLITYYPFVEDWDKIVTVRNPYERAVSEFKFQMLHSRRLSAAAGDINEALRGGIFFSNMQKYHDLPQVDYLPADAVIVKFENLKEDFFRATGIKSLPHEKIGPESDITLNDMSKRLIYEKYSEDFERLGYKK